MEKLCENQYCSSFIYICVYTTMGKRSTHNDTKRWRCVFDWLIRGVRHYAVCGFYIIPACHFNADTHDSVSFICFLADKPSVCPKTVFFFSARLSENCVRTNPHSNVCNCEHRNICSIATNNEGNLFTRRFIGTGGKLASARRSVSEFLPNLSNKVIDFSSFWLCVCVCKLQLFSVLMCKIVSSNSLESYASSEQSITLYVLLHMHQNHRKRKPPMPFQWQLKLCSRYKLLLDQLNCIICRCASQIIWLSPILCYQVAITLQSEWTKKKSNTRISLQRILCVVILIQSSLIISPKINNLDPKHEHTIVLLLKQRSVANYFCGCLVNCRSNLNPKS